MPTKINRKTFLGGICLAILVTVLFSLLLAKLASEKYITIQDRELVFFAWLPWFIFWLFLVNARCNDIGMSNGKKIAIIIVGAIIPGVNFFVFLYMLFARGAEYEQSLRAQNVVQSQTEGGTLRRVENFSGIKNTLLKDLKSLWILIFCFISLASCIFYVPYNLVSSSNPNIVHKTAHATIFEIPKDFRPQLTKVDYESLVFREILLLIGCFAGYTISKMVKKK